METGIIRRLDDLGRVVIPRSIRKPLQWKAGDPLDIKVEKDKVIIAKYNIVDDFQDIAKNVVNSISDNIPNIAVFVFNTSEQVIAQSSQKVDFQTSEKITEVSIIHDGDVAGSIRIVKAENGGATIAPTLVSELALVAQIMANIIEWQMD